MSDETGMLMSEQINELGAALAKAQAEIKGAKRDADNPHLRNRYADLASVWDAIRDPLTKNGLAVSQLVLPSQPGAVRVTTMLIHASGQYLGSTFAVPYDPSAKGINPAQAQGSALTYARRYGLSALVGVVADDDDAQASGPPRGGQNPPQRPPQATPHNQTAAQPQNAPAAAPQPVPQAQAQADAPSPDAFEEVKEPEHYEGYIQAFKSILADQWRMNPCWTTKQIGALVAANCTGREDMHGLHLLYLAAANNLLRRIPTGESRADMPIIGEDDNGNVTVEYPKPKISAA